MAAWIDTQKTKKGIRYYIRWRVKINGKSKIMSKPGGKIYRTAILIRNKMDDRVIQSQNEITDSDISLIRAANEYLEDGTFIKNGILKKKKPNTLKGAYYAIFTLLQYLGYIQDSPNKPNIYNFLGIFKTPNENAMLSDINEDKALGFRSYLIKNCEPHGVNIKLNAIKAFFKYCVERKKVLKATPFKEVGLVDAPDVATFINKETYDLVFAKLMDQPELKKVIPIYLWSGMRADELLTLQGEQIREEGIFLGYNTKTGKPRVIPIKDEIKPIIDTLPKKGPCFPDLSYTKISNRWRYLRKKFNFEKRMRLHDFRHTFISNFILSGNSIAEAMAVSGHTSLKSVQKYIHLNTKHLQQKVNSMVLH